MNRKGKFITVYIQNCNGFYYNNCKTGFGTSSTTVVAFVTSLLLSWNCLKSVSLDNVDTNTISLSEKDKFIISSISMQAHFEAQGKVGSGYDIITAIHGSCIFEKQEGQLGCLFTPFHFPECFDIVFSCGGKTSSKTSSFVKEVMKWRRESNSMVWKAYETNNRKIIQCLVDYEENEENEKTLHSLFEEKLEIMYRMSKLSNVEIVPDTIYSLMKQTNQIPGVLGCIVAGAGGYDSFYCIYRSGKTSKGNNPIRPQIQTIWEEFGYPIANSTIKKNALSIYKKNVI